MKNNDYNKPKIDEIEYYLNSLYEFRNDVVSKVIQWRKKGAESYEILNQSNLEVDLYRSGFKGFKDPLNALLSSDYVPKYNPFEEYFLTLPKWNPSDKSMVENLLSFVRLEDESKREFFNCMVKKHLVRAVGCVLRKISFNKHCLVLVGKQHDGKTSFIRNLCPTPLKAYYLENPPLDHKDSSIELSRNLIINLDELEKLDKQDANKIKSLFSQESPKVRLNYDKFSVKMERYASFFGTTNDSEFLNDVTGNVRWLVFEIDGITHDNGGSNGYMPVSIDSVWSEALHLLENGFEYNLNTKEIEQIEAINRKHQRLTTEIELMQKYFEPCPENDQEALFVQSSDLIDCLGYACNHQFKINSVVIGKALTYLGYKRSSKRLSGKNPIYGYYVKPLNEVIKAKIANSSYYLLQVNTSN